MATAYIQTDGACRGNPGPSGAGVVIRDVSHRIVATKAEFIGEVTNNVAEYIALAKGLEATIALGFSEVSIKMDSQVVVRQVIGQYRVKETRLEILHAWVMDLLGHFDRWEIAHIKRELNALADKLANDGIDQHFKMGA